MKFVFLGSPPFATQVFERLLHSPFRPELVVTPPPRPRGRGRQIESSPVAALARAAGVEVLEPESVRNEAFLEKLRAVEADIFLVVSYGELLRQEFLDIPRQRSLNVHPSLLPRHRGATPIQAALLAGDEETGVSIQEVVLALDAGDVLAAKRTSVLPGETAGELAGRLAVLSGELVVEALQTIVDGTAKFTPQDPAAVTICKKLSKADGVIDWSKDAHDIDRLVRAMNPWPVAHTTLPGGKSLAVWRAQPLPLEGDGGTPAPGRLLSARERMVVTCGSGALELVEVQVAGKQRIEAASFLRGNRIAAGEVLGAS